MKLFPMILAGLLLLTGCGRNTATGGADQPKAVYRQVSAADAAALMESASDYILLDVRTQEEFDQSHIPGAICLPNEFIAADMPFPFAKDTELLLYCRSGHRSAEAAEKLRDLGFSNVFDFGGILDWPYDITTE